MSMRLLPKGSLMLPDTAGQDRPIERPSLWRRHGKLAAGALALLIAACMLGGYWLRYSGAGASVERSRLTIATVERGSFVRDIAADGQVVAAVSPTLYADALGTVSLKVHAGDAVAKGQVLAVVDSPDLTAKLSQEEVGCSERSSASMQKQLLGNLRQWLFHGTLQKRRQVQWPE